MSKRGQSLESKLMQFACVDMGYCGSVQGDEHRHFTDRVPKEGPVTAADFVEWVIWADGREPDLVPLRQKRDLRDAFIRVVGGHTIDARRLRYS